jgi:hypothetical protein
VQIKNEEIGQIKFLEQIATAKKEFTAEKKMNEKHLKEIGSLKLKYDKALNDKDKIITERDKLRVEIAQLKPLIHVPIRRKTGKQVVGNELSEG